MYDETRGQARAVAHTTDTAKIEITVNISPAKGELAEIFNQLAVTRRVCDIASLVAEKTLAEMEMSPNPRQKAAGNESSDASNVKFCKSWT